MLLHKLLLLPPQAKTTTNTNYWPTMPTFQPRFYLCLYLTSFFISVFQFKTLDDFDTMYKEGTQDVSKCRYKNIYCPLKLIKVTMPQPGSVSSTEVYT